MSDFLNAIDPTNLAVVVRNLVQRMNQLESRLNAGNTQPNGQLELTDDGINIADLGYGLTHETTLNNVLRRWRLGSFDVSSGAPAGVKWDYLQELGPDFFALDTPSAWTHDANTSTIIWDTSGADLRVSFVNISAVDLKWAYSPYYNLPSTHDIYLNGVLDLVNPTGGFAYEAALSVTFYDINNTSLGTAGIVSFGGTATATYQTNAVVTVPDTAVKIRFSFYAKYDSASGPSSADIYVRIDPALSVRSVAKLCIDIFRKAFSALSNTTAVSVAGAGSASWDATKLVLTTTVTTNPADTAGGTSRTRLFPCVPGETYYGILSVNIASTAGTPVAYLDALWYDAHQVLIQTDVLDSTTVTANRLAVSVVAPESAAYVSVQFRGTYATGGSAHGITFTFSATVSRLYSFDLYQALVFDEFLSYFDGINGAIDLRMPMIHIRNEQPSATDGGTFTSGADRTRVLNTIHVDTQGLAKLASNQVTVPAGVYRVWARCPAYGVDRHQAVLYSVTDSADVSVGSTAFSNASTAQSDSIIIDRVVFTRATILELRHRCQTTIATYGLGVSANFGRISIYAEIILIKEQ
jgi:hypothetical protein